MHLDGNFIQMWSRRDFIYGALTAFNVALAGYVIFLYFYPAPTVTIRPTAEIGLEAPALAPNQQRMYTRHPSSASSTRRILLSVAPEFGAEQRNEVLEAAAEWNFVLNGYVQFVVEISNGPALKPGRRTGCSCRWPEVCPSTARALINGR